MTRTPEGSALLTAVADHGRRVSAAWRRLARTLGDANARLLLALFYFVVLAPFALLLRWRADPLGLKAGAPRGWRPLDPDAGDPAVRARRQF